MALIDRRSVVDERRRVLLLTSLKQHKTVNTQYGHFSLYLKGRALAVVFK